LKIGLHEYAFGLVFFCDQVPTLLSGGAVGEPHFCGVRELLQEEVSGDRIFIFPLINCFSFLFGRVLLVGGHRGHAVIAKVPPATHHLYGAREAHLKDGPIGAIGLEVGYIR
jgi:hypothetical protein